MKKTLFVSVFVTAVTLSVPAQFLTSVPAYTVPTTSEYTIIPLLSVGDRVPETSNPSLEYQMIGIPDGLGAYANRDGTLTVYMNHELPNIRLSEPVLGGPTNRGALVSKYIVGAHGVISGERAYDDIYKENAFFGPAPEIGNDTPSFSRFCSGALAWREAGFDRPIYFCGEESSGAATFDGRGGIGVAIFDNELHTLPKLGRFAFENPVPRPERGQRTVIICMEDGPSSPDSQLYMYVGFKDPASASPLRRNGLDNGDLYVFVSSRKALNSEISFQSGSINGKWVRIPGAEFMTDVELEAASDAVDAFGFIRTEDGAFRKDNSNEYYFVTTGAAVAGAAQGNLLGRLYRLELNPLDPTVRCRLSIIYNADQIIAAGGDIAISPDNIDINDDYIMIQEDGTAESRPVMAAKGRKGGIWRLNLPSSEDQEPYGAEYVAELTSVGRDGIPVGPGVWETSGIIDVSSLVGGTEAWLFDVQAHFPTTPPAPNTVEDGQLLIMLRNHRGGRGD
jgi:hypothetical protein